MDWLTSELRAARRDRVKAGGLERRIYAHMRHGSRPRRTWAVRDTATGGVDYLAYGESRAQAGVTRRECLGLFGSGATELVSFIVRPTWFEELV